MCLYNLLAVPSQLRELEKQVWEKLRSNKSVVLPDNPFATPLGPTFPEFAQYVINAKYDDDHWATYYDHCSPCHVRYDFVLRWVRIYEPC